jgi:hypothetical protein
MEVNIKLNIKCLSSHCTAYSTVQTAAEEKKSIKGIDFSCINSVVNVKLATEDTAFVDKGAASTNLNRSLAHITV